MFKKKDDSGHGRPSDKPRRRKPDRRAWIERLRTTALPGTEPRNLPSPDRPCA